MLSVSKFKLVIKNTVVVDAALQPGMRIQHSQWSCKHAVEVFCED